MEPMEAAFSSDATYSDPESSFVVLADFTAPPADTASATAAILSSSGTSARMTKSYSPKEKPPPSSFPPTALMTGRAHGPTWRTRI